MPQPTDKNLLERLGPCGLNCGKCFAFQQGDIARHSRELIRSLGNFDVYAQRFETLLKEPLFAQYPVFKTFLHFLAQGSCGGCRKEKCKIFKGCGVRACSEEKRVDFCFQCAEFPCRKTGFDEHLYKRHVQINRRMKEAGVNQYALETKDQSRY